MKTLILAAALAVLSVSAIASPTAPQVAAPVARPAVQPTAATCPDVSALQTMVQLLKAERDQLEVQIAEMGARQQRGPVQPPK